MEGSNKKKLGQPVQIESPSSLPRAVGHHSGSAFLRPRKGDAESNGKGAPQDQSGVHHGKQSKKQLVALDGTSPLCWFTRFAYLWELSTNKSL